MVNDPRVDRLLEEIMDSGLAPEVVCRDCPELLPVVLLEWQRLKVVEAELAAVFPTHGPTPGPPGTSRSSEGEALPDIPGYSDLSVLGSGGMGVVYKAHHLKLNREVAVKMLLAGGYAAPPELARFMREAQAIASLRHPNIVQVFDVGEVDRRPYFTMEYVEGGSLAQKLGGIPQPARRAAEMVATIAAAMQVAHDGGIVHRDLKPANILLTEDGTPKITDFGLARRYEVGTDLTLGGTRLGTPSYMSPEQAIGREGAIGPSTDVYSLGAVLYEMLTGRPPFKAETPAETERQVIVQDPAAPSRLNARVPRDLETICLKCLNKDPQHRYACAAALAEDLHRFLRGEPVYARRAGAVERMSKWVRRRPSQALAVILATVILFGALSVIVWTQARGSAIARTVQDDLRQIGEFQTSARWADARTSLERAKTRLNGDGPTALRARVLQAERELDLVARLDVIRLQHSYITKGQADQLGNAAAADREYAKSFLDAGLIRDQHESPKVAAQRVRASNIRGVLLEALDDWTARMISENDERAVWLMEIAREADPDPEGWRNKARQLQAWNNRDQLAELTGSMPEHEQSLALPLAMGMRLGMLGGEGVPFLQRVQEAHPSDYWANYALGRELAKQNPKEAVQYLRATAALRPEAAVAHTNLGVCLGMAGDMKSSLREIREALRLSPESAPVHNNLGYWMWQSGDLKEALSEFRRAVMLEPNNLECRCNLGAALFDAGRPDEAIKEFQHALKLDARSAKAHDGLGLLLKDSGHPAEALPHGEEAVRLDPTVAGAHLNLALTLLALKRWPEARAHGELAIQLAPGDHRIQFGVGQLFRFAGRPGDALPHYQEAARLNPRHARSRNMLGFLAAGSGDLVTAVQHFEAALQIDPSQVNAMGNLGAAYLSLGRFAEARAALVRCLDSLPAADGRRGEVSAMIDRCDTMMKIEGRLEAVLGGDIQPRDALERAQFAALCRIRKRYGDAARLYADAFAEAPSLVDDLKEGFRFDATCSAALAATEVAGTGAGVSEEERARWRHQACQWLREDLSARVAAFDAGRLTASDVGNTLSGWSASPDLRGQRDAAALEALPTAEREEWQLLWKDVAAALSRLAP